MFINVPIHILRFSQAAISKYYIGDGRYAGTIYDVVDKIKNQGMEFNPGLRVFTKIPVMDTWGSIGYKTKAGNVYAHTFTLLENGCTYVLNNRSLAIAILAGYTSIGVFWVHPGRVMDYSYDLSPIHYGEKVLVKETGQYISIPKE